MASGYGLWFLPTKITFPQEGMWGVPVGPLSESITPQFLPLSGAMLSILTGKHLSPTASLCVVARIPDLNKQLSAGCHLYFPLWDAFHSRQTGG